MNDASPIVGESISRILSSPLSAAWVGQRVYTNYAKFSYKQFEIEMSSRMIPKQVQTVHFLRQSMFTDQNIRAEIRIIINN